MGGFAATRLDDIARRAGVAKGTIYLYFRDKEALFQELLLSMFKPILTTLQVAQDHDRPVRDIAEAMVDLFVREILGTRRKDVIRLIIAEGTRFPELAEFHYREVVGRVMGVVSALMQRGIERGEISHPGLAQFPQLLLAPGLMAVVWGGLFDRFAPIDVAAMMRVHLDILFGQRKAS